MKGYFLRQYFNEREHIGESTANGEIQVRCPFHKDGKEESPSASINIEKGLFKCFTCETEGRFRKGGMTEPNFVKYIYGISYAQAIKFIHTLTGHTNEDWQRAQELLQGEESYLAYLKGVRGLTDETIQKYHLGYTGTGISYPVFVNGTIADVRTYNPTAQAGEPKMMSMKGVSAYIYPFDEWLKDDSEYTILNAGENDVLLNRQHGLNAITSTLGEGSLPKMFHRFFHGRKVIVMYDCDNAGKLAAPRIAFYLKEWGANVFLADISLAGLTGSKDDKDVTDYYTKHDGTADELKQLVIDTAVPFTDEMYNQVREREYPTYELWDINDNAEHFNKYVSTRAMVVSKSKQPIRIPSIMEGKCTNVYIDDEGKSPCHRCPLADENAHVWELDQYNLHHTIQLSDNPNELQHRYIKQEIFRIPSACKLPLNAVANILAWTGVELVALIPDVESESEMIGFKDTTVHAYVLEDENGTYLDNGGRFRFHGKPFKHHKNQLSYFIVDRFENSDNSLNTFKVTPDIIEQLSQFQGHPNDVMPKRWQRAKDIVGEFAQEMVVYAVELTYHSVLDMYFQKPMKGHPEGVVISAPNSGKSDVAEMLQMSYGMGNVKAVKGATFAGLVGGNEQAPHGGWQISWGAIPRNNGGLLILDELSGVPLNVLKQMTSVRSKRIAEIEKIASGRAQAKTRLLWLSNPAVMANNKSRNMADYSNGVDIVTDLVGSNEDIRRFDFIITLPSSEMIDPKFKDEEEEREDFSIKVDDDYRNLIRWAWTRKIENVKFAPKVEIYIWEETKMLNHKYHAKNDLHILGHVGAQKLARIAASVAVMCFSHDGTGENLIIKKEHVDWAIAFLHKCYDNDVFRLPDYVKQVTMMNETDEETNAKVAELIKSNPTIMTALRNQNELSTFQLQYMFTGEKNDFQKLMATLSTFRLIEHTNRGLYPTGRFRKAIKAYEMLQKKGGRTEKVF
jgi:hypothetical protein